MDIHCITRVAAYLVSVVLSFCSLFLCTFNGNWLWPCSMHYWLIGIGMTSYHRIVLDMSIGISTKVAASVAWDGVAPEWDWRAWCPWPVSSLVHDRLWRLVSSASTRVRSDRDPTFWTAAACHMRLLCNLSIGMDVPLWQLGIPIHLHMANMRKKCPHDGYQYPINARLSYQGANLRRWPVSLRPSEASLLEMVALMDWSSTNMLLQCSIAELEEELGPGPWWPNNQTSADVWDLIGNHWVRRGGAAWGKSIVPMIDMRLTWCIEDGNTSGKAGQKPPVSANWQTGSHFCSNLSTSIQPTKLNPESHMTHMKVDNWWKLRGSVYCRWNHASLQRGLPKEFNTFQCADQYKNNIITCIIVGYTCPIIIIEWRKAQEREIDWKTEWFPTNKPSLPSRREFKPSPVPSPTTKEIPCDMIVENAIPKQPWSNSKTMSRRRWEGKAQFSYIQLTLQISFGCRFRIWKEQMVITFTYKMTYVYGTIITASTMVDGKIDRKWQERVTHYALTIDWFPIISHHKRYILIWYMT